MGIVVKFLDIEVVDCKVLSYSADMECDFLS